MPFNFRTNFIQLATLCAVSLLLHFAVAAPSVMAKEPDAGTSSSQPKATVPASQAANAQPKAPAPARQAAPAQPKAPAPARQAANAQPKASAAGSQAANAQPKASAASGQAANAQPKAPAPFSQATPAQPKASAAGGQAANAQPKATAPARQAASAQSPTAVSALLLQSENRNNWKMPKTLLIFDRDCAVWCEQVKPIVKELQETYKEKMHFVSLDTSTQSLEASRKSADNLGLSKFFKDNMHYAPVVGVFDVRGKLVKELVGPKDKAAYRQAIESAIINK